MATKQLEARSLSTINYLAANPPQYPHHPELKESLTLYISRVPGTQDLILSTFRPHRKNVTGADIANSLYYIHLDSPEDSLLAAARTLHFESAAPGRSSSESTRSMIPRKPLPPSAKLPKLENSEPSVDGSYAPPPSQRPRSESNSPGNIAFAASPPATHPRDAGGYRENPMFRKLGSGIASEVPVLPPRPPRISSPPSAGLMRRKGLGSKSPGTLISHDIDTPTQRNSRAYLERPVTPTQLEQQITYVAGPAPQVPSPTSHLKLDRTPSPLRAGRRPCSASFSLTVIRRDPTSGSQCNVGKVSSFQTNVPPPDRADPNLDPENMGIPHAPKIDIHIETSGYAKYRDMPSRASVDAYRLTSEHSFSQQVARGAAAGAGGDRATALKPAWEPIRRPAEGGFSRQVVMSYGPSWKTNFKKAFHRRDRHVSTDNGESLSPVESGSPRPAHARQGSASTIGSVDSDGGLSTALITQPGPGLKPKGYVFLSPWQGRCEFRTSTNGRSLKCRHVLESAKLSTDPRDLAQNIRDAQGMGRSRGDELSSALGGAKPVSELRFNLPNGDLSRVAGRENGAKDGHLSGHFSKFLHRQSPSSDEEDDEDVDDYDNGPMDLSLGKENAGGGNRGNRAKLGKLIIHDEGLKMLDLVVAANIGVWWNTWGRTF
ncbi:Oxidoreductase-like protein (Fragment) [Madurella fahalii]|uniref:Oxidoreductase-like protein n=1 Tax=Madurella fahalii TaxID=1157608 RepID=A0ABQ0GGE7_9PEZI